MTAAGAAAMKKKPFHYEFGGPIGAAATTLSLPIVILLLAHWSQVGYVDWQSTRTACAALLDPQVSFWQTLVPREESDAFSQNVAVCTVVLLAWFGMHMVLWMILPGETVLGAPVKGDSSNKLAYKLNGHFSFWVTFGAIFGPFLAALVLNDNKRVWLTPLLWIYEHYTVLAVADIGLCFVLSFWLYAKSFDSKLILADGGNSGVTVYDFFMGRELNPRWKLLSSSLPDFDWKVFCELRPGLLGWMLLNAACAAQQWHETGTLSGSMILVNLFQGAYVWDALYQERAILTTMDITTDGFGYMLVFGDLAWVPFTYSVQARYLVQHDPHLSATSCLGILALHMLGYIIFRGANGQKDAFRRNPVDPALSHLQYLQTARGTKLLVSGWWGHARKINYTGDYLMGLSWCLTCGFASMVPYYYAVYFMVLLVHRADRDDHLCALKYGADWDVYKQKVPFRFVPGIV